MIDEILENYAIRMWNPMTASPEVLADVKRQIAAALTSDAAVEAAVLEYLRERQGQSYDAALKSAITAALAAAGITQEGE